MTDASIGQAAAADNMAANAAAVSGVTGGAIQSSGMSDASAPQGGTSGDANPPGPDDCAHCNADYPCTSDFSCLGEFADWPMPDAVPGAATAPTYEVTADTVIDKVTHLIWQRNLPALYTPICDVKYTENAPVGDACTWDEASQYCKTLAIDGHSWRLPTKIELESIQDDTQKMEKIDPVFPSPHPGFYWTVSTDVGTGSTRRWLVDFDYGYSQPAPLNGPYRVRCVR